MPVVQQPPSRLFERPDSACSKLEKYWASCWARHEEVLQQADAGPAAAAALVKLMNREPGAAPVAGSSAEDVNLAMLYGVLTADKALATRCMGYLAQNNREGHQFSAAQLRVLAHTHYPQLLPAVRLPLLSLARELIQWEAQGVDALLLSLVRQVATGDMGEANVWLACNLLHTLRGAAPWMLRSAPLTQGVLFKFLRLLPDAARGTKAAEIALAQHAAGLCTTVLTERWETAAGMGRDLARALQDVSQLPEFKPLWRDLLAGRPPGASGGPLATLCGPDDVLAKLLATRTPTTVLQAGLTQDMEKEMYFMLTQVRMGNQKRYQQWFMARHLASTDSETVVPDLVRYICGCYHPPNHILSSEIIPRWAVLGWLMQCARSQPQLANTRLALLFDLLLFQPSTDSIMNIEPAMLLMVHSIPRYASMTNTLLEFLIMAKDHYNPARRALTQRGFEKGISALVQRGVVKSLDPIVKADQLSPALRDHFARTFPRFCADGKRSAPQGGNNAASPSAKKLATQDGKESGMRSPRGLAGSGPISPMNSAGSSDMASQGRRSLDGVSSQDDDPGTPPARGGPTTGTLSSERGELNLAQSRELEPIDGGAGTATKPPLSEDGEGVEGSSPSVSGLAAAVSRMRSALEASLSSEGRDDDGGDVNYGILAGQVVDALVAEQIRSAGGRAQQGPAGASSGVEAAVQGVVECAKLCHDAGYPVFDNLPRASGRRCTASAGDFRAVLAQCPRPCSEQCLGGALVRAATAALAGSQTPSSSRRAALAAVPRLLAALRAAEGLYDVGPCLLSHVVAAVGEAADSCTEGTSASGRTGSAGPDGAGPGSADPLSLQELYASCAACVAPESPGQVLAEDLRGCLRWGLAEGQGCLLRLLRLDAFPLAAGNPAVVEMAASLCMPEQLASLCAALGTGGARLFFAPADSAAASALSVVRQSYAWDGHAQGVMWQLLLAELPARGLPVAEDLASQVLGDFARSAACPGSQSDDVSSPREGAAEPGAEAVLGALALLRLLPPKRALVDQLLALPVSFASLATAALASWLAMRTGRAAEDTVPDYQLADISAAGAAAGDPGPASRRDLTCLAEAWQVPFTAQLSREEGRPAEKDAAGPATSGTPFHGAAKPWGGGRGGGGGGALNGLGAPPGGVRTAPGGGLWTKADEDLESSDESV